eukprot:TRINITY_DN14425_c2_g1_i8.p4 TRINITY_DN14425_c2_g1~~TRINITY_DN14425_c2_g1_i8.p4  ORF type:complete len:115 (-),score=7.21 TRINITY_DN14425_c2_g1_i8:281-625(-)
MLRYQLNQTVDKISCNNYNNIDCGSDGEQVEVIDRSYRRIVIMELDTRNKLQQVGLDFMLIKLSDIVTGRDKILIMVVQLCYAVSQIKQLTKLGVAILIKIMLRIKKGFIGRSC